MWTPHSLLMSRFAPPKPRRPGRTLCPQSRTRHLAATIPPGLKARMQGKSCFNFRAEDPALFAQLEALTRNAAAAYARPFRLEGKGRETRVVT